MTLRVNERYLHGMIVRPPKAYQFVKVSKKDKNEYKKFSIRQKCLYNFGK
jgi:hypothetical protein